MIVCVHSLISPVSESRQLSRSIPTMVTSSLKTNPRPSAFTRESLSESQAVSKSRRCSGLVTSALMSPLVRYGLVGILVGFPSRIPSRQQIQFLIVRILSGIPSLATSTFGMDITYCQSASSPRFAGRDKPISSIFPDSGRKPTDSTRIVRE